jgi:hypothetical protein
MATFDSAVACLTACLRPLPAQHLSAMVHACCLQTWHSVCVSLWLKPLIAGVRWSRVLVAMQQRMPPLSQSLAAACPGESPLCRASCSMEVDNYRRHAHLFLASHRLAQAHLLLLPRNNT